MKKLMFVLAASFAMMACGGNGCTSECANDSIVADSADTIVAVDSVAALSADSTLVNE